ncbi:MAG: hypothetical protein ACERKD_19025 [Prolixibacteraceae bacterium]
MKKLFFLVLSFFLVVGVQANTTRSLFQFKDLEWTVDSKSMDDYHLLTAGQSIDAELVLDQANIELAALYIYGGAKLFSVFIDGNEISNELTGEDFHAEITPFLENENFLLTLKVKEDVDVSEVRFILDNAQLSILNNVFICHIEMMEDPFFGGKMVEAVVRNMLNVDVDGKLIANVIEQHSLKLVAENNNCAFSRQGSEIVIDINFPDMESIVAGQQYLLNISMVDKDKNEEVIDELIVPVRF